MDALAMEDSVLSDSTQAAETTTAPATERVEVSSIDLLAFIEAILEESKADDMVTVDLRGKTSIADYMVVCSGRSTRQVVALAEVLAEKLKTTYRIISRLEGKASGDWVLMDCSDVIVHFFRPEVREFYQLEKMWMQSPTPDDLEPVSEA
jgi:ribosome-associated protein